MSKHLEKPLLRDRFDDMRVESRVLRAAPVIAASPPGESDHPGPRREREAPYASTDLEAVNIGKTEVAKDEVRTCFRDEVYPSSPRAGYPHPVTKVLEPHDEGVCDVRVVLNDHHPLSTCLRRMLRRTVFRARVGVSDLWFGG